MYGLVYGQVETYWSCLHSELVDRYEISISQMAMAVFPLLSLLPMKDMADVFIKQELLVLLVNLYSPLLRLRSVLLIFLVCCVVVLFMFLRFICLRPVFFMCLMLPVSIDCSFLVFFIGFLRGIVCVRGFFYSFVLSSSCVLCTSCRRCLWIVHSWLPH